MKNLKPFYILIGGSAVIALTVLIGLIVYRAFFPLNSIFILVTPIIIGLISYITFYFFIRYFFTEKLKILYRSIRKGKFNSSNNKSFSIYNDVIEQAEQETLQWTKQQVEEISKLKEQEAFRREFLGNLAHELKTPVFSIQGYILTLLEGGLEDESVNRKFLERASKATDRMTLLLEDLDHISKMDVDAIKLRITRFDIKEVFEEVFEALEQNAKEKDIRLKFAKDFDSIFVLADRKKIIQVATNLVINAIHYGKNGGETVVRFYSMDDIITVEVSDNGPGIDEHELPRLFERFYRVEKSRNRNEGGSGLGLAIVKHIIEAHGQTISVRSTPKIGSTFTFGLDKA